ncbi:MAG: nucleotidyltransferase domain-containing protein [Desulfovibrio sp.]|uniref:nucleotidyltransferase domain-containing protein n=1 Tax=Desulfovibrio sp. TaxID=885 RepID=UPI001A6DF7B5|nr:nucleotidyltransferase domain-containing protein [Desulfovibrio sp.]MBD5417766.1 nucleotidyltransferase domain-containing protein [Desulfovibrio sp.]
MIDPATWMPAAVEALQQSFGPRLRFVGLQGSYRRGEASETSDIDLCVILDQLEGADLVTLRAVLGALPEGEKAAGFVAGARELAAWPAFELFAFAQDMDAWYSELAPLLPPITKADILLGVRTAVAALYHEAAQTLMTANALDGEAAANALHSLRKSFLRALQGVLYLKNGEFPRERAEALRRAHAEEAELLRMDGAALPLRDMAAACLAWSGGRLLELPGQC